MLGRSYVATKRAEKFQETNNIKHSVKVEKNLKRLSLLRSLFDSIVRRS